MSVVKACKTYGVERCVITSSTVAIFAGWTRKDPDYPEVMDESVWSKLDGPGVHPYFKSKTLAEKAAWDYVAALPEEEKFELTTICPGFIVGPTFCAQGFVSGRGIEIIVGGKYPGVISLCCPVVDVRDCALAHLNCIKLDKA